jgi:hypothetical protein
MMCNFRRGPSLRLVITSIALAFITCGCTQTLQFRLINAESGEALADVSGNVLSYKMRFIGGDTFERRTLPPTQADGTMVVSRLPTNLTHSFVFKKSGYADAAAMYATGSGKVAVFSPMTHEKTSPDAIWGNNISVAYICCTPRLPPSVLASTTYRMIYVIQAKEDVEQ